MARAVVIIALLLGLTAPAASAQSDSTECTPGITVVMDDTQALEIGFTGLIDRDRLRAVRLNTTAEDEALSNPEQGLIWQLTTASGVDADPVVIKVPEAPAGMTVATPLEGPLPDAVTIVVVLIGPDGRSINLPQHIDVARLRGAPPASASVDVGCGNDPSSELGSIMKSIAVGAGLFIVGVSALLLILNFLLLGVRRAIFGAAK